MEEGGAPITVLSLSPPPASDLTLQLSCCDNSANYFKKDIFKLTQMFIISSVFLFYILLFNGFVYKYPAFFSTIFFFHSIFLPVNVLTFIFSVTDFQVFK